MTPDNPIDEPLHYIWRVDRPRITSTVAFESIRDDARHLSVRAKAGPALVAGARAPFSYPGLPS